jgi:hypothetical protein
LATWLGVAFLAPIVPAAGAETPVYSGPAQQARTAGREAFDRGDFPAAIGWFAQFRQQAPDALEPLYYLGAAESRIAGRELRAIAWYGAYLAARPAPANAAVVRAEIGRLRQRAHDTLLQLLGEMEKAARFAETPGAYLQSVGWSLVDLGDLASARRIAAGLASSEEHQALIYTQIARAQSDAGDLDGALATLRLVDDKQPSKSDAQTQLANTWSARDPAATMRLIGQIADRRTKDRAFYQLGSRQAAARQWPAALATAASIQDAESRDGLKFAVIAGIVETAGDLAEAEAILPLMRRGFLAHIDAVRTISVARAKRGDFAGARRIASNEQSPENAMQLYTQLAQIQAESGDLAGARQTVALGLPGRQPQARGLAEVAYARGLWQRGASAEAVRALAMARQTAEKIAEAAPRDEVWRSIASAEGANRDQASATADAARIQSDYWHLLTLRDLAVMQAEQGDVTGAVAAAGRIPADDYDQRGAALLSIGSGLAKRGDASGALRMEGALPGGAARDRFRSAVAVIQAEAGDPDAAQRTAAAIADAGARATVQNAVDAARLQRGELRTLWLERLTDSNPDHSMALAGPLFLDLAGYLKTLAASEDPKELSASYLRVYRGLSDAEKTVATLVAADSGR